MENTKGLPMDLIRCALAEAAMIENEKLAGKCPDSVIAQEIPVPNYESIKAKAKTYGRIKLKKKILYALIAALIAVSLAMSVSAIRELATNFFVEIYDSFISIFADSPAPANIIIEEKYELGYLPEGFELVEENLWTASYDVIYSDGIKKIRFNQKIYSSQTFNDFVVDNNNANIEYVKIKGIQVVCFRKNNMISLMWHDKKYTYKLIFNYETTKEECEKIIESLCASS